jgi:hypothetical protein
MLFNDLDRQAAEGVAFSRNAAMNVPGIGDVTVPILATTAAGKFAIALSAPITFDEPLESAIRDLKEYSSVPVVLVDELLVRTNLPRASSDLLTKLA